jgi:hypothetical protein
LEESGANHTEKTKPDKNPNTTANLCPLLGIGENCRVRIWELIVSA